jgi:hypothetical protein
VPDYHVAFYALLKQGILGAAGPATAIGAPAS